MSPPSVARKPLFASQTAYGQQMAYFPAAAQVTSNSDSSSPHQKQLDTYLNSSTPPNPSALHGPGSHLYYSELQALLQTGQVKEIQIQINPKSFAPLPTAKVMMKNGHSNDLLLPRDMGEFTDTLEDAHVPYTYSTTAHPGVIGKAQDLIGNVAQEMLAPFALLAATGLLGMWGMKKWTEYNAQSELKHSLTKAISNPSSFPYKFDDMKSNHTLHIQEAMEEFRHGTSNVLILKGYPGLGKTHTLNSLQNASANDKTMVLDVGDKKVGKDALDLLSDLYGGDKELAPKALKMLKNQNLGRPVQEILLVADELEKLDSTQVGTLLTKGTGNPSHGNKMELPKLRLLATCNAWPDFVHDEAVASRIRKEIVPPPEANVTGHILADSLHSQAFKSGLKTLPTKDELSEVFIEVLGRNPGYSPRSLTNYVQPALLRDIKNSKQIVSASDIANGLEEKLKLRPLNSTELAGLIVHNTVQKVLENNPYLEKVKGSLQLWNDLHDPAAHKTKDAQDRLILDGRSAQEQIAKALENHNLSIHDPGTIDHATEVVVSDLKKNRLSALNHLPESQKVGHEVLDKFASVIDEVLKTSELASKVEKTAPTAEEKRLLASKKEELKSLKTALRKPFQAGSIEAGHLKDAAEHYAGIKKQTDPTQPDFMDTDRMYAVMGRALDFDKNIHKAEADYNVIQNENYVNLFKSLRLLATRLHETVPKSHISPRL
jgi:hypothetical protein